MSVVTTTTLFLIRKTNNICTSNFSVRNLLITGIVVLTTTPPGWALQWMSTAARGECAMMSQYAMVTTSRKFCGHAKTLMKREKMIQI